MTFYDEEFIKLTQKLDEILTEIQNKYPHLAIYAHIGDPNQGTLEFMEEE